MSDAARKIDQDEYDAIEQAVLATPKGRWFLEEYARRNRFANTEDVIGAIERLYDMARETSANARFGFLYHDMQQMRRAMNETRKALAAVKPGERHNHAETGPDELSAVAEAAKRAADDIGRAAERLQEIGETLRGAGADTDLCDEIENHATGIFMASAYHEMTGKRISLIVDALGEMEKHIARVIAHWEEETAKA